MPELRKYRSIIIFVLIFISVYLYFYHLRTHTAYGDDLYGFKAHYAAKNFAEQINVSLGSGKYRPIHGLISNLLVDIVGKNAVSYYTFNVLIISLNATILTIIIDLFLNSIIISFLFGIVFGFSRFFYYTINQLLCGGPLEGLALTFFLCSLYYILRVIIKKKGDTKRFRWLLLSLLFANLSLYTHERYIIMFPFLFAVFFLYKGRQNFRFRQRAIFYSIAILSPLINYSIKKFIYSVNFFVGTGGTNIEFSPTQAFGFLKDGILSIFQINSGPDYLAGTEFHTLSDIDKLFALVAVFTGLVCAAILLYYISLAIFRHYASRFVLETALKNIPRTPYLYITTSLCVLFMLCMLPAVATIRLEQRWLVASFAIFLIVIAVMINSVRYKSHLVKYGTYIVFIFAMIWVNDRYIFLGIHNIYMCSAEHDADLFKTSAEKNIIHRNTSRLYLWEKHRDTNGENGLNWALADGYLFDFYEFGDKKINYIDTTYIKGDTGYVSTIPDFNSATTQIIALGPELKDITGEYQKDSLKSFMATQK